MFYSWVRSLLKRGTTPASSPDSNRQNAQEFVAQGISAESLGDTSVAIAHYRRALAEDATYAQAHMNLGIALHAQGELAAAIASHRHAVDLEPGSAAAHFNFALALADERLFEQAEQEFKLALRLQRDFPEAHVGLADVLEAMGRENEALASLEQAIGLRSDYAGARFNAALLLRRAGRLDAAEAMLRELDLAPLLSSRERFAELESIADRLVEIWPDHAPGWRALGTMRALQKRFSQAVPALHTAAQLAPADAEIQNNLGVALQSLGRTSDAEACYQRALQLKPDYHEARNNLGRIILNQGRGIEAEKHFRDALALRPERSDAHANLGGVLRFLGRLSEAEQSYRRALELSPDARITHNDLGVTLQSLGRYAEAAESFRSALSLAPEYHEAHNNLALALQAVRKLTEAEAAYRRALELAPESPAIHSNLGSALRELGRVDEAVSSFRRAVSLDPDYRDAQSNLLFTLNNSSRISRDELFAEHLAWARRHETPIATQRQAHVNRRDPDRQLRIGYVSPDFRRHSVAYFIEPLLERHDRKAVTVCCYSNVENADDVTRRLLGLADLSRSISGMSDAHATKLIRDDGIDILVDLAGHTARGRLGLFALKPAPVQVTYLGYPNTTGLAAIDWRLTDLHADPHGDSDAFYSEQLVRLPDTFLCFRPPTQAPEVRPPPSRSRHFVTFGSFNVLPKLGTEVISSWSKLLNRVHGSRLMLKSPGLSDTSGCARLRAMFAQHGIEKDRLTLLPTEHEFTAHLSQYENVDIGLDPFPYNGTTTTLEALWMGVPVVTLAGDHHASRTGASILTNLGLESLVATNIEDYVARAAELANATDRLGTLRMTMRQRISASPLRDEAAFSRAIENEYRKMWTLWCAR